MQSTVRLLAALTLCAGAGFLRPAAAALPVPEAARSIELMPPPTAVLTAGRDYTVTTLAHTSHRGWTDASGYVNTPQEVRIRWHIDSAGEAILKGRDAWNPAAPWRDLGRWGKGSKQPKDGETRINVAAPTLLWLRVRAAEFPKSGVASLRAEYRRRTVAVLRGPAAMPRRPVIMAEGYDPFNAVDYNDPAWQDDPTFAEQISVGRKRYSLDVWLLDWGDGGAPLQQQAEDFADIARQVRAWNEGKTGTVAVGVSMGSVSLRYALAAASGRKEDLGVRKYLSINGPHQGAWISPTLVALLRSRAGKDEGETVSESSEAFLVRRGIGSPAAQQLLYEGDGHDAFYKELRSLGTGGWDPTLPRVGFSNGTLVKEGTDLAELIQGKNRKVVHRVLLRPLGLPFWITAKKTRQEFRYGAFPGELLPASLRQPVRTHVRYFSLFRFDIKARWETIPTFIPTHSALDFPGDLGGGPDRWRYTDWRKTAFNRIYVSQDRNLPHDRRDPDWIDPQTGKSAPEGQNEVLYEIAQAFGAK